MHHPRLEPFLLGEWLVDPRLDVVGRDGTTVKLVPKTMQVLLHLAGRPGEVVSQEELEAAVWSGVIVTPSSVYQAIADLRRVLGDDRHEPRYIATVPKKGYRLVADVRPATPPPEPAPAANPGGETAPPAAAPQPPPTRRPVRARVATVAALIAAAGVLMFALWWWGDEIGLVPRAHADPKSIAVLPVADFSVDGERDHFAEGLTEEMLNTLAQVPGLKVTARTSVYAFRNRHADVRAIGRMLGTRYVLEGSVRRASGRVRVSAQLIDTRDGYHLWSKTFERADGDLLAIQEDIAHAVADALQLTLTDEATARVAARRTDSARAYELYLLGRHQQGKRRPETVLKAIEYHRQALALDPRFALAYAGLADAHMSSYYYNNRPLAELAPVIDDLVEKGLEVNPRLPDLYAARAVLRIEQFDFEAARRDLGESIRLNPSFAEGYVRLGASHEYDGRPRDALEAFSKAAELDPLHFILHIRRCLTLQNLGRYPDAEAACERAIELEPGSPNGYWTRGLVALSAGHHDRAIADYLAALERAPQRVDLLGQLGWLYLDLGLKVDAKRSFDRAVAVAGSGPGFATLTRTRWYVAAAERDALRAYLDELARQPGSSAADLIDLALMQLIAARPDLAHRLVRDAQSRSDFVPERLRNPWYARWGHSDLLTLVHVARSAGDEPAAERHLVTLTAYLDHLERNGHIWHGLHYLRASVHATRGQTADALRELERAAALGWRRTWWARHDPALASVRSVPAFRDLLVRVEQASAPLRAKTPSLSGDRVAAATR